MAAHRWRRLCGGVPLRRRRRALVVWRRPRRHIRPPRRVGGGRLLCPTYRARLRRTFPATHQPGRVPDHSIARSRPRQRQPRKLPTVSTGEPQVIDKPGIYADVDWLKNEMYMSKIPENVIRKNKKKLLKLDEKTIESLYWNAYPRTLSNADMAFLRNPFVTIASIL